MVQFQMRRSKMAWNQACSNCTAAMVSMGCLAAGMLGVGQTTLSAQSPKKEAGQKQVQTVKPEAAATNASEKTSEAATVEGAARVLDLRTFPRMEGAKLSNLATLGLLMYEAQGLPKIAFEFQRQQLVKLGFKEMPGGYSDAAACTGKFTKEGFHIAVSSSESFGDPKKTGWSQVSLVNSGNLAVEKLPVPPGVKPFFPQAYRAAYTTEAKVAETAAACRKLLLAAGWEPYGEARQNANQPDSAMQYFKRNAIKLQLWVSIAAAEGGKTLIQYDTELLSADLPAPPSIADPDYTDIQKTLRFDAPQDQTEAILAFYQERLPKAGWQPTTEKPVVDDRTKTQFIIYRNPKKDLLSLDLTQFTNIVRVSLKHQTEAEVAEETRLAKEHAERARLAEAKRNKKFNIAVPLPAKTKGVEKLSEHLFEFTLASGSGPAALTSFRDHFLKAEWTEEKGTEMNKNNGNLKLKKDALELSFSYFDTGFTDAEIRVSASSNVLLEPQAVATAEKPPQEAKQPRPPAIPGLPALPPGVELPDDVKDLLKKALQESESKKPAPAK